MIQISMFLNACETSIQEMYLIVVYCKNNLATREIKYFI